jgi:hypothetical protein
MTRLRERITFANVMSLAAVFIALGGGAYAITLKKNSVRSKQIKAGAVKTGDLANNAVTSPKVADGSLSGEDFAAGELPQGAQGPQGERGPAGSPDTPAQVLAKLKQVDGSGSGLVADSVAGFTASDLGTVGRSASSPNCRDDNQTSQQCVSVDLTLPRAGRVFVTADGFAVASQIDDTVAPNSGTDATDRAIGTCSLSVDGAPLNRNSSQELFHDDETNGYSQTTVTSSLDAGTHTFAVRCLEEDGDIDWPQNRITAVMLGND